MPAKPLDPYRYKFSPANGDADKLVVFAYSEADARAKLDDSWIGKRYGVGALISVEEMANGEWTPIQPR